MCNSGLLMFIDIFFFHSDVSVQCTVKKSV